MGGGGAYEEEKQNETLEDKVELGQVERENHSVESLFEYINASAVKMLSDKIQQMKPGRKKSVFVTTKIRSPNGGKIEIHI